MAYRYNLATGYIPQCERDVLMAVYTGPDSTALEIVYSLNMAHRKDHISPRFAPLERKGLIECSGERVTDARKWGGPVGNTAVKTWRPTYKVLLGKAVERWNEFEHWSLVDEQGIIGLFTDEHAANSALAEARQACLEAGQPDYEIVLTAHKSSIKVVAVEYVDIPFTDSILKRLNSV